MSKLSRIFQTALVLALAFTVSVDAKNVMKTATVGDMRIELHILPAEPFFTADEVSTKKVKAGMLIISGAEPLSLEASTHPNRHLVVHIFNAKTGKAITTAKVTISFQPLDAKGKSTGNSINVPIVNMQVIGKGLESTHYGNNVVMPEGAYSVTVLANGKKVSFQVTVSKDGATSSDKMNMH
jgi:hypothetical protein